MAEIIITSFFTSGGDPITGLSPTIRIWEINAGDQNLVIGSPQGTNDSGPVGGGSIPGLGVGVDGIMLEVHDNTAGSPEGSGGSPIAGSRDGFYRYTFDTVNGYVPTNAYIFRVDGGVSQPSNERYQAGDLDATDSADVMVDLIYDEQYIEHLQSGSVGEAINQNRADISGLVLSVADVETLVTLLLKYETNRTRVDAATKTLIIYDDDCTTPLRTFSLRDGSGTPSVTDICERTPTATGTSDGAPTCEP